MPKPRVPSGFKTWVRLKSGVSNSLLSRAVALQYEFRRDRNLRRSEHQLVDEVLTSSSKEFDQPPRFGVVVHIHDAIAGEELLSVISVRFQAASVFLFSISESTIDQFSKKLRIFEHAHSTSRVSVRVVPDNWRDIRSLFEILRSELLHEDVEVFLKIHTKRSPHLPSRSGLWWRNCLIEDLATCMHQNSHVLWTMRNFSAPALSYPMNFAGSSESLGSNRVRLARALEAVGRQLPRRFSFAMGSMFWFNLPFARELTTNSETWIDDFEPCEDADGGWAHAMERVLGVLGSTENARTYFLPANQHLPTQGDCQC